MALSAIILSGFVLWAVNDLDSAKATAIERVEAGGSGPQLQVNAERAREARNGSAREFIDDANDVLLSPFDSLVDSSGDRWVRHGVPALLGLLLYGFGIGFVARYTRGWGASHGVHRAKPA